MIRFDETETELLLYVPFQHKERAKGIDGRQWDPDRKCWVFPKTTRVFDAIVGEFGDDLGTITVLRPGPDISEPPPKPEDNNETLSKELADLKKLIELLTSNSGTQVEKLRQSLANKNQELERSKEELDRSRAKLQHALQESNSHREECDRLRAQLAEKGGSKTTDLIQKLIEIASNASGGNQKFINIIERSNNPERLPLEFAIALEKSLREKLKIGTEQASLHELISQAADSETLSRDGVDLAHTIRKQRNLIAHSESDPQTVQARVFMTLFAAALLWRDFR